MARRLLGLVRNAAKLKRKLTASPAGVMVTENLAAARQCRVPSNSVVSVRSTGAPREAPAAVEQPAPRLARPLPEKPISGHDVLL